MKKALLLLFFVIASLAKQSQAQIITTVAGIGTEGFSGDGGQATSAELSAPYGVFIDAAGNMYISDTYNYRVRKVNTAGIISTFAGGGSGGIGYGGPATNVGLSGPFELAIDVLGNMYISDFYNNCIRKVNTAGIISTIAGNGYSTFVGPDNGGYSGDGGYATSAELNNPYGVVIDAVGNLYISDLFNDRIRMVNTAGIISTFAGGGSGGLGDGGPATAATLNFPTGVAIDFAGNLYFSDQYTGDGGPATSAELANPYGVAIDAIGNLYFADGNNNRIRKINTAGIISTIAGTITSGYSGDGGYATAAELNGPTGVVCDATGNLYISDQSNNRIRKVTNVAQVGIETFNAQNSTFQVYPNPTNDVLHLDISTSSMPNAQNNSSTLVITDMLGNTVKKTQLNTQHVTINIADIEAGVYFITVTSGTGVCTQKVVVSK